MKPPSQNSETFMRDKHACTTLDRGFRFSNIHNQMSLNDITFFSIYISSNVLVFSSKFNDVLHTINISRPFYVSQW